MFEMFLCSSDWLGGGGCGNWHTV